MTALCLAANAVTAALCWMAIRSHVRRVPDAARTARDYLNRAPLATLAVRGAHAR